MKPLATIAITALALAPASLSAEVDGPHVNLKTTTVGVVGQCDVDVQRSVSICAREGQCRSKPLSDHEAFRIPRGGSFTISASAAFQRDGVVQGSGVSDRFRAAPGEHTIVQNLRANDSCSFSFSYDITVR